MKKGFTLIELVGVILLLGVLVTIAVPSYNYVRKNINENLYEEKVTMILSASKLYAKDNEELFIDKDEITITVDDLINNNYIESEENGKIINPVNNSEMNNIKIQITKTGIKYKTKIIN